MMGTRCGMDEKLDLFHTLKALISCSRGPGRFPQKKIIPNSSMGKHYPWANSVQTVLWASSPFFHSSRSSPPTARSEAEEAPLLSLTELCRCPSLGCLCAFLEFRCECFLWASYDFRFCSPVTSTGDPKEGYVKEKNGVEEPQIKIVHFNRFSGP